MITWHYDGTPPWPLFQASYVGGNTVLQWSGMTLPPGGLTHVGFEMAASANPQILSMNWMNGTTLLTPSPKQGNFHWLNNGTIVVVVNNILTATVQLSGGSVEWYPEPVGPRPDDRERQPIAYEVRRVAASKRPADARRGGEVQRAARASRRHV